MRRYEIEVMVQKLSPLIAFRYTTAWGLDLTLYFVIDFGSNRLDKKDHVIKT